MDIKNKREDRGKKRQTQIEEKGADPRQIVCEIELVVNSVPESKFYTFDFGRNRIYIFSDKELSERNYNIEFYLNSETNELFKPYGK